MPYTEVGRLNRRHASLTDREATVAEGRGEQRLHIGASRRIARPRIEDLRSNRQTTGAWRRFHNQTEAESREALEHRESPLRSFRNQHRAVGRSQSEKCQNWAGRGRGGGTRRLANLCDNQVLHRRQVGGVDETVPIRVGALATRQVATANIHRGSAIPVGKLGGQLQDVSGRQEAVAIGITGRRRRGRPTDASPYEPTQRAQPPEPAAIFASPPHSKTCHYAQGRYDGQPSPDWRACV